METVRIGVLVADRDYRNALLRALSHESRDFQFIDVCSARSIEDLVGCEIVLKDPGPFERSGASVSLVEESNDGRYLTGVSEGNDTSGSVMRQGTESSCYPALIHLTYHEMYDMGYLQERMEIFRYEDARVFVNKIIYYYARIKGIDLYFHGKRKLRKVVFSSAQGGSGTTSAAMTTARFLKYRFGKKTLFVSLCPVDGSRRFTGSGDGGNILSLLYHLSVGDDVPLCKFISSSEGVDHFRGMMSNRAASEMTCTELKRLIQMIDGMGEYDYVIFDVGDHIGTLAKFLFDRADVRVVVSQKGSLGENGMMSELLESRKAGEIIRVTDFDEPLSGSGEDAGASAGESDVSLTYDPEAFVRGGERTYIDIRGKYGRDVGRLAERIIGCADEWG